MAFGALGAERPPAPVADEPAFLREAPPAPVADPRQLRRARRAQGQAALDGEQALPLHAPAARPAPPVARLRAGGAHAPHRAVLGRERASAVSAELPHRLRVLRDDDPSSRHDALLLASRRAPWRGPSSTDASMAAERPQRQRRAARVPRAARGECEGRPRGRWFSGLFCGRPAPPSRKRTRESIAALAGQAGSAASCRREARSFVEARGGPGREGGSPRAGPWARVRGGASPGSGKGPDPIALGGWTLSPGRESLAA